MAAAKRGDRRRARNGQGEAVTKENSSGGKQGVRSCPFLCDSARRSSRRRKIVEDCVACGILADAYILHLGQFTAFRLIAMAGFVRSVIDYIWDVAGSWSRRRLTQRLIVHVDVRCWFSTIPPNHSSHGRRSPLRPHRWQAVRLLAHGSSLHSKPRGPCACRAV